MLPAHGYMTVCSSLEFDDFSFFNGKCVLFILDSPIGHIIGTYTATDKDMNPQITYNLSYLRSQNEPQMFSINRKGQLVLIKLVNNQLFLASLL